MLFGGGVLALVKRHSPGTSCLQLKVTRALHAQDDLARAAIPDRDLQLRLIHMLMGGRGSSSGANQQSPSTSSDSGNRKMHSGSSVSPGHDAAVSPVCNKLFHGLPGHEAAVSHCYRILTGPESRWLQTLQKHCRLAMTCCT